MLHGVVFAAGLGAMTALASAAPDASTSGEPKSGTSASGRRSLFDVFVRIGQDVGTHALVGTTDGDHVLRAGSGFSVLGGLSVVPLRRGRHSAAVSIEAGYKSWAAGDFGDVDFRLRRVPLTPRIQYRYEFPTAAALSLLVAAGPHWDLDPNDERRVGDDYHETHALKDATGFVAELGMFSDLGRWGGDLTIRYTRIMYETGTEQGRVDGSSVGVFLTISLGLLLDPRVGRP